MEAEVVKDKLDVMTLVLEAIQYLTIETYGKKMSRGASFKTHLCRSA